MTSTTIDADELALLESSLFGFSASSTALPPLPPTQQPLFKINHKGAKQSAWQDPDDSELVISLGAANRLKKLRQSPEEVTVRGSEYTQRLQSQFEKLHGEQKWLDYESDSSHSSSASLNALVRTTAPLSSPADNRLAIARCKDANASAPSRAVVQALDWHPSGQVLLTGGMDKTLHLFRIDGKTNAQVGSYFFESLPILQACFAGPQEIILTGRRPYYYSLNADTGMASRIPGIVGRHGDKSLETMVASPDGSLLAFGLNDGFISLVSTRSKREVLSLRLNGSVRALCFNERGDLLASGEDGDVYKFDLRSPRPVWRRPDEGSLGTRALGAWGELHAVGSTSGVVNVYRDETKLATYMNLTTAIDALEFSPDGKLLLFSSRTKKDSLRVAQLDTLRVAGNWPTRRTPLSYVSVSKFSPHGGYLAVGNDKGRVLLMRLEAYSKS